LFKSASSNYRYKLSRSTVGAAFYITAINSSGVRRPLGSSESASLNKASIGSENGT